MIVRRIRHAERRRGSFSLIEILAAMTLTAVLFGSTAMLTALLFRLERLGRDDLAGTMTAGRLAADFRSDVHAAMEFEIEGDRLTLRGPGDRRVEYEFADGSLVRREGLAGGAGRFERYRLRAGSLARWEGAGEDGAGPIVLIIEPAANSDESKAQRSPIRIEARPGRDHRYSGGANDDSP